MGLTDAEAKLSWVDVTMAPEKKSTKHRLRQQIEDTVEYSFAIRGNDIATFRKTPGNRVQEPQENGQDTANIVGATDIWTESECVLTRNEDQDVHDVQEGNAAEDIISPLSIDQ